AGGAGAPAPAARGLARRAPRGQPGRRGPHPADRTPGPGLPRRDGRPRPGRGHPPTGHPPAGGRRPGHAGRAGGVHVSRPGRAIRQHGPRSVPRRARVPPLDGPLLRAVPPPPRSGPARAAAAPRRAGGRGRRGPEGHRLHPARD
ncbi:hypothetical protein KXX11_004510, partial [Aspergillus fumigatus]